MNQQNTPEAPRQAAVNAAQASLIDSVTWLDAAAERLVKALAPVLGPESPTCGAPLTPPESCPLADSIEHEACRVREITNALIAAHERLEIAP